MNNWNKLLGTIICCNIILFLAYVSPVKAQIGERIQFKSAAVRTSQPSSRPKPSASKVITRVRTEVRTEIRKEMVKTSNLTVSSEAGAKVVLKSSTSGVKTMEKVISKNNPKDKTVEFENLRPGKYTVTTSLDGYITQETEVTIAPQKTVGITLNLESYKYQLNIETNVADGEVRFAPAKFEGTNPDGSLKTTETGGYCIVPIKNKKAIINELQKGYYNIDIRPAAVEYQPVLTAINLPTDILLNEKDPESSELQGFSINLDKKISTEEFGAAMVNGEWNLQQGWKLQDRKMKTAGLAGIALPRNEQYRYYTNFEMISDVVMTDGNSIGFALRAINPQNYYSLYISGAKAPEPHLATGYVVVDGKSTLLFSNPITNFAKTIKARQSFRVIIKGNNNAFKIFIEDGDTGNPNPVGNMVDRDKTFRKGAVGIIGRENADSVIGTFTVCANSCSLK